MIFKTSRYPRCFKSISKNMKSIPNSIKFILFFASNLAFSLFSGNNPSFAQGFNDNEWIFGECNGQPTNNYLSFGKGGIATVQSLPSTVLISAFNNAIAIDPITGQPLFITNGELVYDFASNPLQGSAPGLNGDFEGHQKVATGFLEYDTDGNKLFYIFYISRAGQLQYSLVDMNAPGQAAGNERPLGQITQKDQPIGPAQGAVLVVKNPASPSYLISFDNGNLVSRRIDSAPGSLPLVGQLPVSFTPRSMIFDPERGELVLVSENPTDDILVLDFDSSTGDFSNPRPITGSGNSETIGGVSFSPDDAFIYFSRGENLYRVPSDDLSANPELIPFAQNVHAVHDLKIGPDGNLYYIYEEVAGGPQLIGRVTNPNEPDLALLSLDEDPFAGTDFCGRIFPVFAPNADIDPTLDFTWSPEEPCANNPIQLTSEITPTNYRPVSFSWTFDPPLTDENGDTLALDFSQEHFLVPADAAQGTEINVTLTVTFADGTTLDRQNLIPLTENNLQANFTPSDTTVCESCLDLNPLLEAQAGGGAGGGTGGSVGGGAGGGTSYEYFWSNKRNEGWIAQGPNEVCEPGLYWVLVREPDSDCYAYAEIRIRMWDVEDQANNIWYFGDGSGLDFNPDPDDPNAPTPRPLAAQHPRNIPAGTNTISDQAGEVLFYTDGQSVWDLNGDLMANGDSIGGDNTASQSVLAVPVPDEQTLFYLFTTQTSANGSNEVRFSLVDIKAENPTGVGNVVSKANFLFSPSTEQTAGFNAGDTTWVMFHELGNNTFRAYPVSANGIGQPVMSSVGSNHGFNSGAGTMKFSPDGTKLAVTITEGGTNRVEIFDFDPATGQLTEYARIDLGTSGEVYGLEFSNDSDRIFVSYRNGGPGIEEFIISAPSNDDPAAPTCPTCFGTSTNREAIETCILSTRAALTGTTGLDLGALQIGPDGSIYAAVVGSNRIGQISAGTGCTTPSSFSTDGVEPLTGTSNLGLPSFIQNSGSSIPEPSLSLPATICLDPAGGSGALLGGGGEPDIDSYFWTITAQDGAVIRSNFGGPGDEFQSLEQEFTTPGIYTVDLRVDRCAEVGYYTASGEINVLAPPTLTLADDVTLCAGNPVTLTAIEGYDPTSGLYDFQWVNAAGQVFGDVNSNSITVDQESIYTVTVTYRATAGAPTCPAVRSVFAGPAFEFELTQSASSVCFEDILVSFAPDTPISGDWYYTRNGDPARIPLGTFFTLELSVNRQLPSPGNYQIFFLAEDPILPGCNIEKQANLIVSEMPSFSALQTTPASSCTATDGSFTITMQAAASTVNVVGTSFNFANVAAGAVLPTITGLRAGIYTIEAENGFGCSFSTSVTITNANPPAGFGYTVSVADETCSPTGVEDGVLTISFTAGPQSGSYEIVRQEDGTVYSGTFPSTSLVPVAVPHGTYLVNVIDPTGCAIPSTTLYTVAEKLEVAYSVPTTFSACVSFTFAPSASSTLTYTLRDPDDLPISVDASGNFTLTKSGIHVMSGSDPSGINCPRMTEINATITAPVTFSVSGPIVDCQVGVRYEAILPSGTNRSNLLFLWRDELGIIVGRREEFVPSRAGNYSLEIQPISGGACPNNRIPFAAVVLDPRLTVSLDVEPFCTGQTTTSIAVNANLSTVVGIEWYRLVGATRTRIPSWNDSTRVNTSQEGIYEVLLRSAAGCELGRASSLVVQSTIIPPVLPASILICAAEGVTQSINPGRYDNYVWRREGNEVSRDSIFTPTQPGTYELRVSDNLGCEYIEEFEVVEDCQLKISLPNAMVLSDPSRNFILHANEYIDKAEVFIFNRWGELIFYCTHENLNPGTAFCPWDGVVNGKFVPVGTYAVKVKFTSQNQNKTQSITKAITIIQ